MLEREQRLYRLLQDHSLLHCNNLKGIFTAVLLGKIVIIIFLTFCRRVPARSPKCSFSDDSPMCASLSTNR